MNSLLRNMKKKSNLVLISSIILFILLSNNVFAQVSDTDSDGIPDSSDSCPTDPETFNGFEDSDGCPDTVPSTDTDSDGIPDSIDSCPTQAETINGFQDSDGWPDVITTDSTSKTESEQNNTLLQWTAVIASIITAVGAVGAAKLRKQS